jgi:RNA polymerase sigma factor (sigma-70 family)
MALMNEPSPNATGTLPRRPQPDFESFFIDQQEALFRALWLVTRNRHEAEEIMQEAFVRLFERWSTARDPEAYLYRTAMNVFRSRLRRAAVAVRKAVRTLPQDDQLAEVEARESVVRALAPLPARQRAAIVLVDVLGLSSEQAGRALGIQSVTVRVLAARGRARLREAFHEDG